MNKIISLLLVGVLAAGVTTAHAESPIFKKKKKKGKTATEQTVTKDSTGNGTTECSRYISSRINIILRFPKT